MAAPVHSDLPPALRRRLRRWLSAWGTPELASTLRIEFSPRLSRAFGRCYQQDRLIRLAASLRSSQSWLLAEILCHEAAHAAVWKLHRGTVPPHGEEWKALMRAAGFRPRLRVPVVVRRESLPSGRDAGARAHCPVCDRPCGVTRGGRPVRCESCARRAAREAARRGKGNVRREGGSKSAAPTASRRRRSGEATQAKKKRPAKRKTLRGPAR